MNKEVWLGQNSARFVYLRYKDTPYFSLLILGISLFICFLLIFQIIMPQFQEWFSIRDEVIATRAQIEILQGNAAFMSGLNKNMLESNRKLAIRALPVEKDFGEIINAVVTSAAKSGVSIDDFSFNLGLISTTSAELKKDTVENDPKTRLSLSLKGDIDKVKNFITEIGEKVPISEVEYVDANSGSIYVSLIFHSKLYKQPSIFEDEPIRPLTSENNSLFSKLSEWVGSTSYDDQPQQSSQSAVPLF